MPKIKVIFVKMPEAEHQAVRAEAKKLGLSLSAFIRLLIKQWSDGITFEKKKADVSEPGERDQAQGVKK